MKQLLATTLQKALNHYIALDPEAKNFLQTLHQKVVTIELLGTGLTMQLQFADKDIIVKLDDFATADTIIRGAPVSLLHLTVMHENRKQFFSKGVSIRGDLDVGQQVINLFDNLDIDWEEHFARIVGDVPAHHLGRTLRRIKGFSRHVHHTLTQQVNEYIHEEINLFPTPEALHDFYQDVDLLRMEVDRLDAKITRLNNLIRGTL